MLSTKKMDVKQEFGKCANLKDYELFIVKYRNGEEHYTHKARLAVIKIYSDDTWVTKVMLILGAIASFAIATALLCLAMNFEGTSSEVGGFIGFFSCIGVLAFSIIGIYLFCLPFIYSYRAKYPLLPEDVPSTIDLNSAFWELTCLKKSVRWLENYVKENNSKLTNMVVTAKHILEIKKKLHPSPIQNKIDWIKDNIGQGKDVLITCGSGLSLVVLFFLALYAKDEYKAYKKEKDHLRFEQQMKIRQEQWNTQLRLWEEQNKELGSKIEQLNSNYTSPKRNESNDNRADHFSVSSNIAIYPISNSTYESNESSYEQNQAMAQLYVEQYKRMERNIESAYNSLVNVGYSYVKDGSNYGYTGRDDSYIAQQISIFKSMQRDMANIRYEASKLGCNIPQSHWESANISL